MLVSPLWPDEELIIISFSFITNIISLIPVLVKREEAFIALIKSLLFNSTSVTYLSGIICL